MADTTPFVTNTVTIAVGGAGHSSGAVPPYEARVAHAAAMGASSPVGGAAAVVGAAGLLLALFPGESRVAETAT
jgi:hypothetical protein